MQAAYRGRFAPSPTGPLHLGSLFTALAGFLQARANRGEWHLRIDDLDTPRCVPGAADDILRTLERFHLHWDGPVVYQSRRRQRYQAAIERLREAGWLYPCRCSRRMLPTTGPYPGRCRRHPPPPGSGPHALRVKVSPAPIVFTDRLQGEQHSRLDQDCGDFVVFRRDGLHAYQLAVVVDDADLGVTEVLRGIDLLDSTPRQIHLQRLLGLPTPDYCHLPVLVDPSGAKLSKQTGARPVGDADPGPLLHRLLQWLGQQPPAALARAAPAEILAWAVAHWHPQRLSQRRQIVIMPEENQRQTPGDSA